MELIADLGWKNEGEKLRQPETPYIRTLSDWDVDSVLSALDSHERGQMQQSGLLWQWCQRDERLKACLGDRAGALPSLPFAIEAASVRPSPEEEAAARILEEGWHASIPEETIKSLVRTAVGMGVVVAHIAWRRGRKGLWWPRLTPWPPSSVYWDDTYQCYKIQTRQGADLVVTPGNGRWLLWEPEGRLSFQYGALLALALPCLITSLGWQDMVNYNDAYGHPVTKAIVPRGAPAAEVDTFMTNLRDISLRTRSTLVCKTPHNLDGSKFDFTYEHPGGTEGTAAFERQIDLANKAKAIVLKGQSLTTDVSSPGLALGDARQQVEQRLFRGDAEGLATTLRRDVCRPWARWNFRKVSLAPWPSWDTSPPADKLNETQAAVSAAQAIVALQAALKGTGRRLNVLAFLEQQGLPLEDDPGPVAATPPLTEVST